jgi:hypothetical protein
MKLRIGMRLRSVTCSTQVIVVRAPADMEMDLTCGGESMVELSAPASQHRPIAPGHDGATQLGKRYARPDSGVEVLCTHGGDGSLWLDGAPLELMSAKPLPASD